MIFVIVIFDAIMEIFNAIMTFYGIMTFDAIDEL